MDELKYRIIDEIEVLEHNIIEAIEKIDTAQLLFLVI